MKSVMISIRPEWCEKILRGEKTVEIRKTRPRLEPPFTVYIYMTAGNASYPVKLAGIPYTCSISGGKVVVGEFTCDAITELAPLNHSPENVEDMACLTREQIVNYCKGRGFAWHISNLQTYGKPNPLRKFHAPLEDHRYYHPPLRHPPQSWRYVEEITNGK